MPQSIIIRPIIQTDDSFIAAIIRATLIEFGAARPGTVFYDESTDRLSQIFGVAGSTYFIAEQDGMILGGAGVYPTDGLGASTCELVKMYLLPEARGKGLGLNLINKCIDFAQQAGYKQIYLETMPELSMAIRLYTKCGFEKLTTPLGQSGHFGCDIWMSKDITI